MIYLLFSLLSFSNYYSSEGQVTSVKANGTNNNYRFSVTIKSPDKGCQQYADWWEVVSEDGALLYRRILAHSHTNEQPFTRSGSSFKLSKEQVVIVRMHMNNSGYSLKGMKGTFSNGFQAYDIPEDFATGLEKQKPLPNGCAF